MQRLNCTSELGLAYSAIRGKGEGCISLSLIQEGRVSVSVQDEVHAEKNLERKEGVWFGSLLCQSLQKRTDIVLEDKK